MSMYKNISMQSWYILNITIFSLFLADSSSKTRRPTNVIRPPSNLPRVDEEPTTSDQTREVETVDRGVGPTPLPPPIDPRLHQQSPYYGVQPLLDPRNGLLDYPYGNLPYGNSEMPGPFEVEKTLFWSWSLFTIAIMEKIKGRGVVKQSFLTLI